MDTISTHAWEQFVQAIAHLTRTDGGAAFKLDRCEFLPMMDIWSFPKYPGKTRILPPETDLVTAICEFIHANEMLLNETDCWLGTWINPYSREYYLDIATGHENLEEAKQMAYEAGLRDGRQIVAIYNSLRKETVFL